MVHPDLKQIIEHGTYQNVTLNTTGNNTKLQEMQLALKDAYLYLIRFCYYFKERLESYAAYYKLRAIKYNATNSLFLQQPPMNLTEIKIKFPEIYKNHFEYLRN